MKNNCNYSTYNLTDKYNLFNDNNTSFINNDNQIIDNNDNIINIVDNLFNDMAYSNENICGKLYNNINDNTLKNKNNYSKIDFNKLLNDNNLSTIKNNNYYKFNNINIIDDNTTPFLLWMDNNQKPIKINNIINNNLINDNISKNDNIELMKKAFYSNENIDYLQKSIIIKVYNDTNKNIILKKQKYEIIIQIMNSFWINKCKYLPYNYREQIEELNNLIIQYSSEELIKEAYFYLNYLKDKDNRDLINTPINTKSIRSI